MTSKVVSMEIPAGIQRDGTVFDSPCYVDGKWVRFQRGRPRKIGGYDGIFLNATGVSRGMAMTAINGFNYVVSGYNNGLQQWVTNSSGGIGSGPYNYILNNFTASDDNLWQFDIAYDSTGNNTNNLVAHPGQNLRFITSSVNTPVLYGTFPGSFGYLTGVTIIQRHVYCQPAVDDQRHIWRHRQHQRVHRPDNVLHHRHQWLYDVHFVRNLRRHGHHHDRRHANRADLYRSSVSVQSGFVHRRGNYGQQHYVHFVGCQCARRGGPEHHRHGHSCGDNGCLCYGNRRVDVGCGHGVGHHHRDL